MSDFATITRLDEIEKAGDCVRATLQKEVVNQGFVTFKEPHLINFPAWYWLVPAVLAAALEANNLHLEEMGFPRISAQDEATIRAALPLSEG